MFKLEARLDAIKHVRLELDPGTEPHEKSCHRPDFSLWASYEPDDGGALVSLRIGELMGQGVRFASLTPAEARRLARLLNETAAAVERAATTEPVEA